MRHEFTTTDIERFWSKVNKDGPVVRTALGPCWIWTTALDCAGYGKAWLGGRDYRAPRAAWLLQGLPIPPKMFVCHHCDNPPCVRPDHLFVGTNKDNVADREAKGRGQDNRGECHPSSMFLNDDIRVMRALAAAGHSHASIGQAFGTAKSHVYAIVRHQSWVSVLPESRLVMAQRVAALQPSQFPNPQFAASLCVAPLDSMFGAIDVPLLINMSDGR